MAISPAVIKELRDSTGAGIVDVKNALDKAGGDRDRALDILRSQGQKVAAKKASRTTREGCIGSYVHANGKVASLVALACETDFVARNAVFTELAHDLALHVAALGPEYLTPDSVPADVLEKERAFAREQARGEGKPAAIVEKIVDGKLAKYFEEHCLLQQPFVKDDSRTIEELIAEAVAKLGEKIEVRDFVYFPL